LFIKLGQNAKVHHSVRTYGANLIGDNCIVLENVLLGFPDTTKLLKLSQLNLNLEHAEYEGTTIGNNVIIRSDAVIYSNVVMGNYVRTGHKILIRENTRIGSNVLIGTNTVIDNNCEIGSHVSIQSGVYLPANTRIEDYVFLGPSVTLANDRYPIREKTDLPAPIIRRGASVGANATGHAERSGLALCDRGAGEDGPIAGKAAGAECNRLIREATACQGKMYW
jgi:UDP-3-O-[3-hydroxymyristoyl] glucosamine N-acyltransferase